MKKFQLFIGIDVSKEWIDTSVFSRNGIELLPVKRFSNNKGGFNKMTSWIQSNTDLSPSSYLFCFEDTGVYSMPLCCFLSEGSYSYCLESGLRINKSMGIKRGKSDPADARIIARYLYLHRDQVYLHKLPTASLIHLKVLLSYRERLLKQKHAMEVSSSELSVLGDDPEVIFIQQDSKNVIEILNEKLKIVEKKIKDCIKNDERLHENYKLSTSVKGIGLIITAYFLVYTNNFTRFENWRKFSCYCGTAPFEYTSGTSIKAKTRVSHLANKMIKAFLTNGAYSAIQHDRELRAYYRRKLQEGKEEFCVINVIRNKLISRVFAAVKRGTPYVSIVNY
jgi:transposase